MRLKDAIQLISLSAGLLVLEACKRDDAFVVGGGSGLGNASSSRVDGSHTETASTREATGTFQLNATGTLAGDLTGPIVHVAGDTLLLTGVAINDFSNTLPEPLSNTGVLIGNHLTLSGDGVKQLSVTLEEQGLADGVTTTIDGVTGSLVGDSFDNLLGGTTNTVAGTTNVLSSNNSGNLLGGITATVGSVTQSVGEDGTGNVVNGVTETLDDVTGDIDTASEGGLLDNLLGSN